MRKLENSELERLNTEEFHRAKKFPIIIVLDNVRSLNNVGSIFRTADAFLLEAIYLCGITGTPPNRDIEKTALGATQSVDWFYFPSTQEAINALKKENYQICAIEQAEGAILLKDYKPNINTNYALVFGNEINGVHQEIVSCSDVVIEIPQQGTKHSLNIAVSAGIVVWDFFSKLTP